MLLPDSSFRLPSIHLGTRLSTWLRLQEEEHAPRSHPLLVLSLCWSFSKPGLRDVHLAERIWIQPTSASSEETKTAWKWPFGAFCLTVSMISLPYREDLQRHSSQSKKSTLNSSAQLLHTKVKVWSSKREYFFGLEIRPQLLQRARQHIKHSLPLPCGSSSQRQPAFLAKLWGGKRCFSTLTGCGFSTNECVFELISIS